MAKSRTDVESVVKLVINGEQAKTSMKEITDAVRKYETELRNMREADDPDAYREKADAVLKLKDALGKAREEVSGLTEESKKAQQQLDKLKTESVVKLVINGQQAKTSISEITNAIKVYEAELQQMKQADDPNAYRIKADAIAKMKNALKAAKEELHGVTEEAKDFHLNWKDIATGILTAGGISVGIDTIKSLGIAIFETTAKFEKLEAVLTTTLGSRSMAKLAMSQLQDFASKTPFQVDELTESFVKLANQGFKPNMTQLRQLGDLSASTGKSFDQLTEAIIDAQTGEFERLKEFGIRASKQGDQVAFTFKGVTQTVKFTSDAIRDYITNLGDAEGVSGSMAGISETLSGKVSNLGDNWRSMLKNIGDQTKSVFTGAIDILNQFIGAMSESMRYANIAEKHGAIGSRFSDKLTGILSWATFQGDVAEEQRQQFGQKSDAYDKRIAEAKYFSQLIAIQKELVQSQKEVDRSTRQGAAYYSLYAEKLKIIKDRAVDIKNERHQDQLKKESQAAKEAAEAAEKRAKELEKEQKAAARKFKSDQQALEKSLASDKVDAYVNSLSGLDRALAEIDKKYDPVIEKANKLGNTDAAKFYENQKKKEQQGAYITDVKTTKENDESFRKGQYELDRDYLDSDYAGFADDINSRFANGEIDENKKNEWLANLEEERLIAQLTLAQSYGEKGYEYEQALLQRKIDLRQKDVENQKTLKEAQEQIEASRNQLIMEGADVLKSVLNKRSLLYKAAVVAEKAAAIAEIVRNTQAEISGYFRQYALVPGGFAKATILSAIAVARSGVAIAKIGKSGIDEMKGDNSGNSNNSNNSSRPTYALGGIPDGPSHANGGIKLVSGLTGQVLGEMEGGEPIISKEVYARNPELIDSLLYAGKRRSNASLSLSLASVSEGERASRFGGSSISTSDTAALGSGSSNYYNLDNSDLLSIISDLSNKFDDFAKKPWEFPMRTFYDEDDKNKRIRTDATA